MSRGDVYWVDFEPARGSEPNKKRPAIIVSRDESNTYVAHHGIGTLTVVPLTSNTRFIASFQVLLAQDETGLSTDSKAQTELIRTVSVDRIGDYIGTLSRNKVWELEEALKVHLNL